MSYSFALVLPLSYSRKAAVLPHRGDERPFPTWVHIFKESVRTGCPTLAAFLLLQLGWETSTLNCLIQDELGAPGRRENALRA